MKCAYFWQCRFAIGLNTLLQVNHWLFCNFVIFGPCMNYRIHQYIFSLTLYLMNGYSCMYSLITWWYGNSPVNNNNDDDNNNDNHNDDDGNDNNNDKKGTTWWQTVPGFTECKIAYKSICMIAKVYLTSYFIMMIKNRLNQVPLMLGVQLKTVYSMPTIYSVNLPVIDIENTKLSSLRKSCVVKESNITDIHVYMLFLNKY